MQTQYSSYKSQPATAVEKLKIATAGIHERLHRSPRLERLQSPEADASTLLNHLQMSIRFHRWCFHHLQSCSHYETLLHLVSPSVRWLQHDLQELSGTQDPQSRDTTQRNKGDHPANCAGDIPEPLPEITPFLSNYDALGTFLGVLYVKEGSLMGNRVILSALQKCRQIDKDSLSRYSTFLSGWRDNSLKKWRAVQNAIDAGIGDDAHRLDAAVYAAKNTFSCFELLLNCQKSR